MNASLLSWVEASIIALLCVAWLSSAARSSRRAHGYALLGSSLALLASIAAWLQTIFTGESAGSIGPGLLSQLFGVDAFAVDQVNAPLLPLIALIHFTTILATTHTKAHRLSFARTLVSEALLIAIIAADSPWLLIGLLVVSVIPPALDLRALDRSIRVYAWHMSAFTLFLTAGWALVETARPEISTLGYAMVLVAVAIRSGLAPVHCWVTDYFEKGAFGTAQLTMVPLVGALIALRLLAEGAPAWMLRGFALIALITAIYTAAMSLVQSSCRRFYCYIFLNQSSLVMAGLALGTSLSITGALCLWASVALGMTGFGLTLRAIEARIGRVSLVNYQGLQTQTPTLAAFFLITGLAAVGFPGTIGFFGTEILLDSASRIGVALGVAVVLSAALIGISVVRAYAIVFLGARHPGNVNLTCRPAERLAVLSLAILLLGGVLWPQPWITSRSRAAEELLRERERVSAGAVEDAGVRGR